MKAKTNEEKVNETARAFYNALQNMIGENDTTVNIEEFIESIDETVQQIIEGE